MQSPVAPSSFYFHAGTHKTGTTSIQMFLAANAGPLYATGVYVPALGRPVRAWGTTHCGHHNAAWQLTGIPLFDPRDGSFEQVVAEAAANRSPSVVMSSEELEYLHAKPDVLEYVAGAIRAAGFVPKAVIYLRTQAEYFQSVYAEGAKGGYLPGLDYEKVAGEILRTGAYVPDPNVVIRFEYSHIVDAFAKAFGRENTIVRAYRPGPPEALLREFAAIIAPPQGLNGTFRVLAAANVSPSIADTLAAAHQALLKTDPSATAPAAIAAGFEGSASFATEKFDVLVREEAARFNERFADDNARLERDYGVTLAPSAVALRDAGDPAETAARRRREFLFAVLRAWKVIPAAR